MLTWPWILQISDSDILLLGRALNEGIVYGRFRIISHELALPFLRTFSVSCDKNDFMNHDFNLENTLQADTNSAMTENRKRVTSLYELSH